MKKLEKAQSFDEDKMPECTYKKIFYVDDPNRQKLTTREYQVLQCILQSKSNKEIAETLNLSKSSVKVYISNIFRKLKVQNRVQAVIIAILDKLVEF